MKSSHKIELQAFDRGILPRHPAADPTRPYLLTVWFDRPQQPTRPATDLLSVDNGVLVDIPTATFPTHLPPSYSTRKHFSPLAGK